MEKEADRAVELGLKRECGLVKIAHRVKERVFLLGDACDGLRKPHLYLGFHQPLDDDSLCLR